MKMDSNLQIVQFEMPDLRKHLEKDHEYYKNS